jgi:hypothetical protein
MVAICVELPSLGNGVDLSVSVETAFFVFPPRETCVQYNDVLLLSGMAEIVVLLLARFYYKLVPSAVFSGVYTVASNI